MKLLIVQTAFLGDVILATPVIKAVKQVYPEAEIYFLTTPAAREFLLADPLIKEVLVFDKRGEAGGLFGLVRFAGKLAEYKFDLAFSIHKSYRTALLLLFAGIKKRIGFTRAKLAFLYTERVKRPEEKHEVLRSLSILDSVKGDQVLDDELRLFLPQGYSLPARLQEKIKEPYVLIAAGSARSEKRWPSKNYKAVAEFIRTQGYQVIAVGSSQERDLAEQILPAEGLNLAGETSLQDVLFLLRSASALVCNDSMILHAASATKTPCIAVFCATRLSYGFGPWKNDGAIVIEHENKEEIAPEKVITAVKKILNK